MESSKGNSDSLATGGVAKQIQKRLQLLENAETYVAEKIRLLDGDISNLCEQIKSDRANVEHLIAKRDALDDQAGIELLKYQKALYYMAYDVADRHLSRAGDLKGLCVIFSRSIGMISKKIRFFKEQINGKRRYAVKLDEYAGRLSAKAAELHEDTKRLVERVNATERDVASMKKRAAEES